MSGQKRLLESEMLEPVLTLFPSSSYRHLEQVCLGRKRIDVVCLRKAEPFVVAIELKIADWRRALWQANLNLQISNESYIAIWEDFVHRAEKHSEVLKSYGVGLIAVSSDSARIIAPSRDPVRRIARDQKGDWYQRLLRQPQVEA